MQVIDEIGSQEEVEAACRIGFKGIALVATAHANNLKEAMDNVALQSLFGGFQTSTVSDQTAQRSADGRKFVEQRRSAPVFKSLVELGRGSGDEWVVYEDLEGAIDMILGQDSKTKLFRCPQVKQRSSRTWSASSRFDNSLLC